MLEDYKYDCPICGYHDPKGIFKFVPSGELVFEVCKSCNRGQHFMTKTEFVKRMKV